MRRIVALTLALAVCILPATLSAGDDDAEAIKGLLERLRKKDERAIAPLAKHGAAAVPGLIAVLKEGDAAVQGNAIDALGRIGPPAKAAIPHLTEGLIESTDDGLAARAAQSLGQIGPAAVPELVKVLNQNPKGRAFLAARALGQIGPDAREAGPALIKQLKVSKEPRDEAVLIDALIALGPGAKDAVPALVEVGKSRKKSSQIHILVGLGKIGPAAKEAVPYLAEIMSDTKQPPHVRIHAFQSLGQIAPSCKEIAESLKLEIWPRPIVIETLAQTGPVSKEARAVLEEAVSSKDPITRVYAAQGLGKGDPKDRAAVSVLIESLREKDAKVRRLAAVAIGEVRLLDPAVARSLEKAASGDSDAGVRQAAAAALKKLERK